MSKAQPKRGAIEAPGASPKRSEGGKRRKAKRAEGTRPAIEGLK